MTARFVYKIMSAEEWAEARRTGYYPGAPIDQADGFVHLSAADQVGQTVALHFAGRDDLMLIAFPADAFAQGRLVWEPSRGGALFPHLYDRLNPALACAAWPIGRDEAGTPILPAEIDEATRAP